MLVQTQASGERKVWAQAHKHAAPVAVIEVEAVLLDPALFELQMPAVFRLRADRGHDARRFAGLQDADHRVGLGAFEVGLDELIAAPFRGVENRHVPFHRAVPDPVVDLCRDIAQNVAGHRIQLAVAIEEADDALFLLERLNDPVQQNAIEASIVESDARLVVLAKGVHADLQCGETPGSFDVNARSEPFQFSGISRAKPLASLELPHKRVAVADLDYATGELAHELPRGLPK